MKKIILFVTIFFFIIASKPVKAIEKVESQVRLPEFYFEKEVNLLNKMIDNDVLSAGGKANIDKNTVINGYLMMIGGEILIDGTIKKNVIVGGGDVRFGPNAKIDGYLVTAGGTVTIDPQAQIKGERIIRTGDEIKNIKPPVNTNNMMNNVKKGFNLVSWMGNVLTLMIMVVLFKNLKLNKKYLHTILKGFGVMILWPLGMFFLIITVVGAPIGLIGMMGYFVCLYLANLVSAWAIGRILVDTKVFNIKNEYLVALLGLILLSALKWIPGVGALVSLISVLWGLGIIWQMK